MMSTKIKYLTNTKAQTVTEVWHNEDKPKRYRQIDFQPMIACQEGGTQSIMRRSENMDNTRDYEEGRYLKQTDHSVRVHRYSLIDFNRFLSRCNSLKLLHKYFTR